MKNLMTRKESVRYPGLFVKKYTRRVFYDNLWAENSQLVECRGHVEDANGRIVINPFTKIFNRNENSTDIHRDEECVWIRKINGFMAAATFVPSVNDVVISTTGSLDSDFVDMAREMIPEQTIQYIRQRTSIANSTFIFEIVHEKDPHIIPDPAGAYLLGARWVDDVFPYESSPSKELGLDGVAKVMGVMRPEWGQGQFSDVVQMAEMPWIGEGVVVYGQESKTALKIKSKNYLIKKFLARKGPDKLMEILTRVNPYESFDEEFYPLINEVVKEKALFSSLGEQERLSFIRDFLGETNGQHFKKGA